MPVITEIEGKTYIVSIYSSGLKFQPQDTDKPWRWTYVPKRLMKLMIQKLNAEGMFKLNIPPEEREWLVGASKKKSVFYDISKMLLLLFPNKLRKEKGLLISLDRIDFDKEYPEALKRLMSGKNVTPQTSLSEW